MSGRVIVFGSINLDLVTRVKTLPLPGETVIGSDYQLIPGGKGANQALAAAQSLTDPKRVLMTGCVGEDDFASRALSNLSKIGLDLKRTRPSATSTGIAMIGVDENGENSIVVCPGANGLTSAEQLRDIGLSARDVLLTQQEVPLDEVFAAHAIARQSGAIIVHNAAPAASLPTKAIGNMDYLIVNETEAEAICREHDLKARINETGSQELAFVIAERFGVSVILTLGENGAVSVLVGNRLQHEAIPANVVDTTGAGDVFCGTFAACLADGISSEQAVEKAMAAASRACEVFGAQSES